MSTIEREHHFNQYCRTNYIKSISNNIQWSYVYRELAALIILSLKNPFVSSPFRLWVQEQGYHLNNNDTLCVRMLEGEESVAKVTITFTVVVSVIVVVVVVVVSYGSK